MNPVTIDNPRLKLIYEYAAAAYWYIQKHCHDELDPVAAEQRQHTAWSFAVLRGARLDIQLFTGRLIQYEQPGTDDPGQIAPDHFVVVHPKRIDARERFAIPYQPVGPLVVIDYTPAADRKYEPERRETYQERLKALYYLRFDLMDRKLTLFRLADGEYVSVRPNPAGRQAVPELEMEAATVDDWVRFWFRGELLPLPADVLAERAARLALEAEFARMKEELARGTGTP